MLTLNARNMLRQAMGKTNPARSDGITHHNVSETTWHCVCAVEMTAS
jgi:hypothetical protein